MFIFKSRIWFFFFWTTGVFEVLRILQLLSLEIYRTCWRAGRLEITIITRSFLNRSLIMNSCCRFVWLIPNKVKKKQ